MIEVKDLHKRFGANHVLRGIDERIEKGEKVVIVGPSGSWKSTFLRCLNLLEKPDAGEVWFEGVKVNDPTADISALRRRMGMVFQHFTLFPNLTILDNITLAPTELKLQTRDEAVKNAKRLL